MACNIVVPCPLSRMTVREAHEAAGLKGLLSIDDTMKPRGMSATQWAQVKKRRQRELDAENASLIEQVGSLFVCGDVEFPVCACGHAADFLCDYPVGRGKTCDLALCGCCRESIGEERDLCRVHAAQFRGAERVTPKFSKPKVVR